MAEIRTRPLMTMRLTVNGMQMVGATPNGGRRVGLVAGRLAADLIDLAPVLTGLPQPQTADRQWSRARLPAPDLSAFDIDLRVSASRAC